MRRSKTVSAVRKSHAMSPHACARTNVRQLSDARWGAGSMPACLRIAHTLLAASGIPRRASSTWIRRQPQVGLSRASRTTRSRTRGNLSEGGRSASVKRGRAT